MAPLKVDSYGTHIYTPPSHLSPTCIYIVARDPYHILDSDHGIADEGIE